MPELIAQGVQPDQCWRRRLAAGPSYILGRQAGAWSIPWDEHISRQHVELSFSAGVLTVAKLRAARNPVFFLGQPVERCTLRTGQHFVLGSTSLTLVDELPTLQAIAPPVTEHTFFVDQLRSTAFRDATRRIDVLSRLPEIIPGDIAEEELCSRLVSFLLAGIPRASWVAVVACDSLGQDKSLEVLHWDHRRVGSPAVSFSEQLIRQTLESRATVAHVWTGGEENPAPRTTASPDAWAFCTPLRRESSRGWCLYVAGEPEELGATPRNAGDLQDDVKFTELVADTVGRLRELTRLERRQTALGQFISPNVLEQLTGDDPDQLLKPREAEVSVLFCDLRGFSRVSEQLSRDLLGLLERVSRALGVMTHRILDLGGVIGDFHGDAAMGFWGWPLEQADRVERACRAALAISADFEVAAAQSHHALNNFRIGIGLATGRAVAGSIGTSDQVKITVFGPVVNLAARLQELTKQLRAPILVDHATGESIRQNISPRVARVRRVARIRPRGMDQPVDVNQVLPPADIFPQLSDEHIAVYEAALDAFLAGNWDLAFSQLHHVPAEDRVKDFLTVFIAQSQRIPPANWDGVIDLSRNA